MFCYSSVTKKEKRNEKIFHGTHLTHLHSDLFVCLLVSLFRFQYKGTADELYTTQDSLGHLIHKMLQLVRQVISQLVQHQLCIVLTAD
uniref:Uncharacterized protein n=1 Tax=Octopus bimaculoides TaxID=37653 RepID=A0A0L8FLU8_OCTBM